MSNHGDGFLRFQALIDSIVDALGEPSLRQAVAKHFSKILELEMRKSRGLPGWGGLPSSAFWTMATTSEFNAAAERADISLSTAGPSSPIKAEAQWRGTKLYLRGSRIYAERLGYRLVAFYCFESSSYSSRLGRQVPKWQACADKEFLDCAGIGVGSGRPQMTHAGSAAAGVKAIRRMAKDFLGVELRDL